MPGYDFEAAGEEVPELICIFCFSLIRHACLLPCGHSACRECLSTWETGQDGDVKCPTCSEPYDKEKVGEGKQGEFIDRLVTTSTNVKCKQHSLNCTWIGKIYEYNSHENVCQFLSFPCAFDGCNENVLRKDATEHRQICIYRNVSCQFCSLDVCFRDEKLHIENCEEYEVTCLNESCTDRMKRRELSNHVQFTCPHTVIRCWFGWIGCRFKALRCNIEKHTHEDHLAHTSLLSTETQRLSNQINEQALKFKQQFVQQEKICWQQSQEIKQELKKHFPEQLHQLEEIFFQQLTQQQQQIQKQQEQLSQQFQQQQQILQLLQQSKEQQQKLLEEGQQLKEQQQQDKHDIKKLKTRIIYLERITSDMEMKEWTFNELTNLLTDEDYNTFMEIVTKDPYVVNMKGKFDKMKDVTLLHVASYLNRIQCVEHLIENGAKINEKAEGGMQPIHYACMKGNLNIVTKLLEVNHNIVRVRDVNNEQPIHYACKNGHLNVITKLLKFDRNVIYAKGYKNAQPIHCACSNGHLNVMTKLLEVDRNVIHSKVNLNGQPIHYACGNGHLNVVTKLIEVDRDVIYAKDNGNGQPIHWACGNGNLNIVRKLLDVDINLIKAKTNNYESPLHIASRLNHEEIVAYLLTQPMIDVNAEDKYKKTPDELTEKPTIKKMIQDFRFKH